FICHESHISPTLPAAQVHASMPSHYQNAPHHKAFGCQTGEVCRKMRGMFFSNRKKVIAQ
ncbi:MAG: hypothetical protein WC696_12750, partial [Candidatus Methylopumilus sp.]